MQLHKNGIPIASVDDWKRLAPPKAEYHWVVGRSAFELAHAWCGSGSPIVPLELQRILESREETRGPIVDEVIPEHRINFDAHGGQPRNADLALVGHTSSRKIVLTIEAKADETFGATVAKTAADALERGIRNPRSQGVRRVEDLVRALMPPRRKGLPRLTGNAIPRLEAESLVGPFYMPVGSRFHRMPLLLGKITSDSRHQRRSA
jgi:hypothetical protein